MCTMEGLAGVIESRVRMTLNSLAQVTRLAQAITCSDMTHFDHVV